MGGHPQADQAYGNATGGAATSGASAGTFGAQQQGLFNTLFGTPNAGGTGTTGGTLSKFMDPNSLNVNSPTGPYALQYQQAKGQGATNTDQTKQAIMRDAGNAGFGAGAPSGYTGFLKSQADMSNAGNNGQLFSQFAGKSYQDALDNFWKASGLASSQTATSGSQQNTAQGDSNQTYSQLYGAAPKTSPISGILNSAIGAGGTVGAAALCVCEGTAILAGDGKTIYADDVQEETKLMGMGGESNFVLKVTRTERVPCVYVALADGRKLRCSSSHTIALANGGYVKAGDATGQMVAASPTPIRVTAVVDIGPRTVFQFSLNGSHTYLTEGIWSLE